MEATQPNSPEFDKGQGKDKKHLNQLQTIFEYLQKHIATASMVSHATGVPQKNICRYKRDLEKAGLLVELYKKVCQLTGFKAWYLTTDKAKFPTNTPQQLNIFQHGAQARV